MRQILLALLLLVLIGCGQATNQPLEFRDPPNLSLRQAYSSICDISSITTTKLGQARTPRGSGVYLGNGFVLTAAHVIDFNENNRLDEDEKTIHFDLAERSVWYKAKVIAMTRYNTNGQADIALLKVLDDVKADVTPARIAECRVSMGDQIVFIGRKRDRPATINPGMIGEPVNSNIMGSSASSWFGASGGGVFNDRNELVGIIRGIGGDFRPVSMTLPIPDGDGDLVLGTFQGRYHAVVPDEAYHSNLRSIRTLLEKHNALPKPPAKIPVPPKKTPKFWYLKWASLDLLILSLVGLLVYRVRRNR